MLLAHYSSPAAKDKQPNIVFILADDLGWQDVGFMGSKWFETPNLDQLAKESMVFENAFMYPTCSPSRAALLTGRQSFRTDCYTVPVLEKGSKEDNIFSRWTVTEEHPVYAKPLNEAGYQLIHLGKWHIVGPYPAKEKNYPFAAKLKNAPNGDLSWLEAHKSPAIQKYYPKGRGFHENVGGCWWGDPARGYKTGYNSESGGYKAPFKNPFIEDKPTDEWLTDRLTADAIDFMKRNKDKPFFVNLHFYAPHRPTVARTQQAVEHFIQKKADPTTGQGEGSPKAKSNIAGYASMIQSVDDNVKRIIDFLDASGLRENTIIVFTSDNGFNGMQSKNKNLRGAKGNVYDGGLRVPSFVNWKNNVKASRCKEPIHVVDYFPTFLELAKVSNYKELLDGDSFVPLLQGKKMGERPIFWHIASKYKDEPCSIIRVGAWKLIQFLKDGKVELYNTEKDLAEKHDLSATNKEKTQQLLSQLVEWRRKNNVPLPPSSSLKI